MSVSFISKKDYIEKYQNKSSSSLIFRDELQDITRYVKTVNKKIYPLWVDTRKSNIFKVLAYSDYKNISNKNIIYKTRVCCRYGDDGAEGCWTNHPLGDVIVVVKKYESVNPMPRTIEELIEELDEEHKEEEQKKKIYITDDDYENIK